MDNHNGGKDSNLGTGRKIYGTASANTVQKKKQHIVNFILLP